MEILSHDPSTGLTLFKDESAEIAYSKQMKDQFMKLMAKRVSNAVRKSAASCIRMGLMTTHKRWSTARNPVSWGIQSINSGVNG